MPPAHGVTTPLPVTVINIPANLTIGTYYYPCYGSNFHKGTSYLQKEFWQNNVQYVPFAQLDAVTCCDVKGAMHLPNGTLYATQGRVDKYFAKQLEWKVAVNRQGCAYVPPVTPGCNDQAIWLVVDQLALSRQLSP